MYSFKRISAFVTTVTDGLFTTVVVPPSDLTTSSWNKFVYRDGQKVLALGCMSSPMRKLGNTTRRYHAT